MTDLWRALTAEWLKLRRTLALAVAFVAPFAIVLLQVGAALSRETSLTAYVSDGETVWQTFIRQNMNWWSLLMLPLFVTLETALVAGLDHAGDHWKQLFALPIRRGAVYAAKYLIGMALVGLSLLALLGFSVLAGLGLGLIYPDVGLNLAGIPWLHGLALCGVVGVSACLVTALQSWVSLRWRSFAVAAAVGIVATVAGVIIINSDYGQYYPWTLPALTMLTYVRESLPVGHVLLGSLGGVLVAAVGGYEMTRRDVL